MASRSIPTALVHKTRESDFSKNDTISMRSSLSNAKTNPVLNFSHIFLWYQSQTQNFRTDHLTFRSVTLANTKFVRASPTAMRAPQAGSTRTLIGCSPIAVAEPTVSKYVSAVTATSATGVCKGPTHCCWATSPVTLRSTL